MGDEGCAWGARPGANSAFEPKLVHAIEPRRQPRRTEGAEDTAPGITAVTCEVVACFYCAFSGGCKTQLLSTQPASCNILLVVIRHPLYPRTHRAM